LIRARLVRSTRPSRRADEVIEQAALEPASSSLGSLPASARIFADLSGGLDIIN